MESWLTSEAREGAEMLRSEHGLERLLVHLIAKYKSLDQIGGNVKLDSLSVEEADALTRFFRKSYVQGQSVCISFQTFVKALRQTRFGEVDPVDLLSAYAGEKLVSNKMAKEQAEEKKQGFIQGLLDEFPHPYCQSWLKWAGIEKGSRRFSSAYQRDSEACREIVVSIGRALSHLPEGVERLPLFSRRITGNPHAFDRGTETGSLFIEALAMVAEEIPEISMSPVEGEEESSPAERETELLNAFGLLRDDIMNYVTCSGLRAFQGEKELLSWQQAFTENGVLNVPLRNLLAVTNIVPLAGGNKVYVVENAGVFSWLADAYLEETGQLPPMVCTQGQFKLAGWLVLDRLVKEGAVLYYSGDFDPEGLWMAQRLWARYPDQVRFWHYGLEDYDLSQSEVPLDEKRLKKLEGISAGPLIQVAEKMKKVRKAGYQEALVEGLLADMM